MKITDLEQYISLQNEIDLLNARITKYQAKGNGIVADTVKDYSTGYGRNIIIRGYSMESSDKLAKAQTIRAERKKRLEEKLLEIEQFVDGISDSTVRALITLRYLERKSWNTSARKVYGYPCGDRARMRITRFFAEN